MGFLRLPKACRAFEHGVSLGGRTSSPRNPDITFVVFSQTRGSDIWREASASLYVAGNAAAAAAVTIGAVHRYVVPRSPFVESNAIVTTQAATLPPDSARRAETWQIAVVSTAHFVSHYHILLLPPLFLFVRDDYGVSYTQVGFALAAYNVISALFQTPAGFLVDRIGARRLLIGGLVLASLAFAAAGLTASFAIFVVMFAVAGLANTVYHPADYAILSDRVSAQRMGQAFSIHTFAGMLGAAAAPASLLVMQTMVGWRGAFIGAALLGLLTAAILAFSRDDQPIRGAGKAAKPGSDATAASASGWRLLMTPVILQNLFFYVLLALTNAGIQNYSVVALGDLFGTAPGLANTALSAYLLLSAGGVLLGGLVAARTSRHALVAAVGLCAFAVTAVILGLWPMDRVLLIVTMCAAGLFTGVIMPSRDMIVREATPPGAFGRVFGLVTTGFNIGGIIAPLLFGALMDGGSPRWVFFATALSALASLLTVMTIPKLRRGDTNPA
jgi:FSR family fosmidomycin resistance protein-like MFS transporter